MQMFVGYLPKCCGFIILSASVIPQCCENWPVTVRDVLINLLKSPIPQRWGKWKSDPESVSKIRSPPKVNQFFRLVGPNDNTKFRWNRLTTFAVIVHTVKMTDNPAWLHNLLLYTRFISPPQTSQRCIQCILYSSHFTCSDTRSTLVTNLLLQPAWTPRHPSVADRQISVSESVHHQQTPPTRRRHVGRDVRRIVAEWSLVSPAWVSLHSPDSPTLCRGCRLLPLTKQLHHTCYSDACKNRSKWKHK